MSKQIVLEKETIVIERSIEIPDKLNIPRSLLGGRDSLSKDEYKRLKKEFENPEKVILKVRALFKLSLPPKTEK